MGNERPEALREVELALWSALMKIATGSTAEVELMAFLREYDDMKRRWQRQGMPNLGLNFFDNGKSNHSYHDYV